MLKAFAVRSLLPEMLIGRTVYEGESEVVLVEGGTVLDRETIKLLKEKGIASVYVDEDSILAAVQKEKAAKADASSTPFTGKVAPERDVKLDGKYEEDYRYVYTEMEKLFQYRFEGRSDLAGHSFGNLFLAAMAEVTGDMETALRESSKVLAVKGRVLPASTAHVRLDAVMEDGTLVEGESHIPEVHKHIRRVKLFPEHVEPVESALAAIREADVVILGPGSLYTSIMPNLLVDGVAEALKKSRALKIYICNVLTQPGETDGYTASMHARAILDHAGRGAIDYMLVNATPLPYGTAQLLEKEGIEPVAIDEDAVNALGIGVVKADLVNDDDVAHHDPEKLMKSVMKMAYKLHPGIGK